jgi:uncharacterized protein
LSAPPITIPGTEVHQLHSDIVGDDYEIYVVPPPPIFATRPVPVVYVTDGNLLIASAAGAVRLLIPIGDIPPVLLVGIGYPTGGDIVAMQRAAYRDLSPIHSERIAAITLGTFGIKDLEMGGTPQFLEFIRHELHPWVKERYSVTDDMTIAGASRGGWFGAWTLFHHPEAFSRYIIGSPPGHESHSSDPWEAEYAATHSDLAATVFLTAGGAEHMPGPRTPELWRAMFIEEDFAGSTQRLGDKLASRSYPSLRLKTEILPGETHFSLMSGPLFPRGLRYVFDEA